MKAAKLLQIDHLLDRLPKQLSGGQRQRVAIGRAIVRDPRVFLFDEPLSNLDAALRVATRLEIAKLHHAMGNVTMVYVTHDQVEAMTLADRICVLRDGLVSRSGTPIELYEKPNSIFVAGAAVGLGDRARWPARAPARRPRRVAAGEALERAPGEVGREALPCVRDVDGDAAVQRARAQHDLALAVTQGVVDEVPDGLAQAQRIGLDGQGVGRLHADGAALLGRAIGEALADLAQHRADGEPLAADGEPALGGARDDEQVLGELGQVVHSSTAATSASRTDGP